MCLLLTIVISSSIYSQAQVTYDKEIEYSSFESLELTDKFLYTLTPVAKTYDQSELVIYSADGEELNKLTFQEKRRPTVSRTAEFGNETIFWMSTGEIVSVDEDGNEISRNKMPESADKVKNSYTVFSDAGITVAQIVKVKKVGVGLRVIRYDSKYQEQWKYEKFPEKGKYGLDDCVVNKDGNVAIIYNTGYSDVNTGVCLLSNTGEEKAFTSFKLEKNSISPYTFEYSPEGDLNYLSYYGSTSTEKFKGTSTGLSYVKIDGTTGELKSEEFVEFLDIQKQVGDKKSDGTPIYNQIAPALQYQDIVEYNGKKYYLYESYLASDRKYTKPSSNPESVANINYYTALTLMDYYLLEVANPKATPVRVWKQSRTIEQELGSFGGPARAANNLRRNNLFSYKGMYNGNIVTVGYGQKHNFYTLIDPSKGMEDISSRTFWGEPISALDHSLIPQRKSYNVGFGQSTISKYFANEGVVYTGGNFLLYQYDYRSNMLQLSKLKF
jgi:hypothetical protein